MAGVGDRGNDRASTINKLLIMLAQAEPAQLEKSFIDSTG